MKKSILVVFTIFIATVSIFSQNVTETRKIKTKALAIFDEYVGIMANLYNGNVYNEDKFLELFEPKSSLYNDILPDNSPQYLSAKEYFDKFTACIKMNYEEYRDLDFHFPQSKEANYEILCTFSKVLSYKTKDSLYIPKHSYDYRMTIEVDASFEKVKIIRIEVTDPIEEYVIIENPNRIPIMYKNNLIIDYDTSHGYRNKIFLLDENNQMDDFSLEYKEERANYFFHIKRELKARKENNHFYVPVDVYFKQNLFGIGFSYTPFGFGNKVNVKEFNDISQRNSVLSLSIFMGIQLAHSHQGALFFNYGIDFNRYLFLYKGTNYTTYQAMDTDGESYTRKIWINDLNEKINSFSLSVPLSFQFIQEIANREKNRFFFAVEIGGFVEYTLLTQSNYDVNVDYHGLYNYFGGVEFDHYYDFGNFDQNSKQTLTTTKDYRYNYGAFGKIGFYLSLNNSNLLKFDIGYKQSFNSPLQYKNSYIISENNRSFNTLLQSTNQGVKNLYLGLSWLRTIPVKIPQHK